MTDVLSLFCVPTASFDELTGMYQHWVEALDARREDRHVIKNQVYCRAAEVALARWTIESDALRTAAAAVHSFVHHDAGQRMDAAILAADQCRAILQALDAVRGRSRTEETFLRRIYRRRPAGQISLDDIREAYGLFVAALHQTAELGAGLMWLRYYPDAEAELQRERRARAERQAAAALLPEPTPEESARRLAGLQAEIDATIERGRWATIRREREHEAFMARASQRLMYAVPAHELAALARLGDQARPAFDDDAAPAERARARAALARLDAALARCARERISFDQPGERLNYANLMDSLLDQLGWSHLGPANLYDPTALGELHRAMEIWVVDMGGPRRAVNRLSAAAPAYPRAMCRHAYHTVRTLLRRTAARPDLGLALLTLLPDAPSG